MKTTQVLVIGAGASGLMAGIMAARSGAKVVIAEQKDRPGRKILATGNGRCNFTNAYMDAACYHDNAFAMQVIRQFPGEQTLAFFRELGIYPVSIEGYYYPASMQASSVLSALTGEAERAGVRIMTYARVVSVSPAGRGEARSAAATGSTATPANSAATPDGIAGSGRKGCGARCYNTSCHTIQLVIAELFTHYHLGIFINTLNGEFLHLVVDFDLHDSL